MQQILSIVGYIFLISLGALLIIIIWHVIFALAILAYKQWRRGI